MEKDRDLHTAQYKFERKYSKIIRETTELMKNNTMAELFAAYDKIKADMFAEAEKKGITLVT